MQKSVPLKRARIRCNSVAATIFEEKFPGDETGSCLAVNQVFVGRNHVGEPLTSNMLA